MRMRRPAPARRDAAYRGHPPGRPPRAPAPVLGLLERGRRLPCGALAAATLPRGHARDGGQGVGVVVAAAGLARADRSRAARRPRPLARPVALDLHPQPTRVGRLRDVPRPTAFPPAGGPAALVERSRRPCERRARTAQPLAGGATCGGVGWEEARPLAASGGIGSLAAARAGPAAVEPQRRRSPRKGRSMSA